MQSYVRTRSIAPSLVAIAIDPDVPTRQFLKIKSSVASQIGVQMETVVLPADASPDLVRAAFDGALDRADGIVLQLPFPSSAPLDELFANLPSDLDPDCLGTPAGELIRNGEHIVSPPVVSALAVICRAHNVSLAGIKAVVVGQGRLVGAPAALWLERQGATVVRLTKADSLDAVHDADLLVLGAGAPGLITPAMIKEGVIILDAGTSEEGGKVVGDADPLCAHKAAFMTPVPGGIGPIAVAELFGNLLALRYAYGFDVETPA